MKRKILSIILAVSIFCTTLATSVSALDIGLTQILNEITENEGDDSLDEVDADDDGLDEVDPDDDDLDEGVDGDEYLSNSIINFNSVDDVIVDIGSTINDIEFPSTMTADLSNNTTIDLDVTWELIGDDEFSTVTQGVLVFAPVIEDDYDIENVRIPNFSVIVIDTKSTFNPISPISSEGPDVLIDDLDSYSTSFYNVWVTLPGIVGGQVKITGNLSAKFVGITDVEEGITIANIPNTVNGMSLYTSASSFKGITSLQELTLSANNFASITSSTFKDCVNLETVTFRNGVDQIPTDAFKGCTSLKTVNMTNTIELVKGEGFANCKSLESIDLTGVTSLYKYAFSGCNNLKQVTLSNSLTSISSYAFYYCESLGSITIPNTVTDIGTGTFAFCTSLTDIYFQGTQAEWNLVNVYNGAGIDLEQTTIHFTDGSLGSDGDIPTDIIGDIIDLGELEIPEGYCGILFVDENYDIIPNIDVKVINETITTDENGIIIFKPSSYDNKINVVVENENYYNYNENLSFEDDYVKMIKLQSDDGTPYIKSVMVDDVNLLEKTVYYKEKKIDFEDYEDEPLIEFTNLKMTFEIGSDTEIALYEIIQGSKIIYSGSLNYSSHEVMINNNDNTKIIENFKAGEDIYLQVTDIEGNKSRVLLGIKVSLPSQFSNVDNTKSLKIGSEFGFPISDSVPFFGGGDFTVGIPTPFNIDYILYDNGKARIAVNFDIKSENDFDNLKSWYQDVQKINNVGFMELLEDDLEFGPIKPTFKLVGYGEGYIDAYGNIEASVGIVLQAGFDNSTTNYTLIGSIPVYVKIGYGLDFVSNLSYSFSNNNNSFVSSTNSTMSPVLFGSLEGGVGISGLASVGASGKLDFSWEHNLNNSNNLFTSTFSTKIVAQLLFLKAENELSNTTFVLYDSNAEKQSTFSSPQVIDFTDLNSYSIISRDYLNRPQTYTSDYSTVKANVFDNAMPKLVDVDGTSYMFWIDDAGQQRSDENRTALVYSILGSDNTWSEAKQVIAETGDSTGDSTGDYNFNIAVVENKVHIVMLKSNKNLTSYDLDEALNSLDVNYIILDTSNSSITNKKITNNNTPETLAKISDNGQYIAWVENSNSDVLSSGSKTIKYTDTTNLNSISTTTANSGVVDIAINNNGIVAYIGDADNDLTTINDRSVYINDIKVGTTGINSKLVVNGSTFYWYSDDNIAYATNSSDVKYVFDSEISTNVNDSFNIISENNQTKIIWQATNEDYDDIVISVYETSLINSNWSTPYKLIDTQSQLTSDLSGFIKSGQSYIGYSEYNFDGDNTYVSVKMINGISPPERSYLHDVSYDLVDVVEGEEIDLTLKIENIGGVNLTSFNATIDTTSKTITTDIAVGETKEVTVKYTVPTNLDDVETIKVNLSNSDDDNYFNLKIGYSDLVLSATRQLLNGNDIANIEINNYSNISTGAELSIYSDKDFTEIVYKKDVEEFDSDSTIVQIINLSAIEENEGKRIDSFYFVITPKIEDISMFDNSDLIYLGVGREVIIEDNNNNNNDEDKEENYEDEDDEQPELNNQTSYTPTVLAPTISSNSGNYTGNTYSLSSMSTLSGFYIPEFRNVIANEYFALADVDMSSFEVNNGEFLGWYYDAEFTRPVELINDKYIVITDSIIQNGLYPKFAGKEKAEEFLDDVIIDNLITNNIIENTPVPSTQVKLLNRLF